MTATLANSKAPNPPPVLAARDLAHESQQAACRSALYAFFAEALAQPSESFLLSLCDASLREELERSLAACPPGHQACGAALAAALGAGEAAVLSDADALWVEYTRLFGNAVVCPHYETDYLALDAFRAVHVIAQVSGFYEAFGVRAAASAGERPDYIGAELEFMSLLADGQVRAAGESEGEPELSRYREAQRRFFTEHVGRWAKPFCRNLLDASRLPLHRHLASALELYLSAEAEHFDTELGA